MQNQIYRGVFYTNFKALASEIKKDSKLNYRGISYYIHMSTFFYTH